MDGATEATWVREALLAKHCLQAPERPAAGGWADPGGDSRRPRNRTHPAIPRNAGLDLTLPWFCGCRAQPRQDNPPIQTGKCRSQDKQTPCCLRQSGPHSCAEDGPLPVAETTGAPTSRPHHRHFRDPATGQQIASHPFATDAELEAILDRGQVGFAARSAKSSNSAQTYCVRWPPYRGVTEKLAALATAEMGKVQAESLAEIEKCAVLCDWYADHGAQFLRDEPTQVPDDKAYVSYLPLGVVLGIMPWNFPYWQVMRAAVPILMGGNGFPLKPAENIVGTAQLLDAAWRDAGPPEGTFIAANISREGTSRAIADDRIAAVTLTGSVARPQHRRPGRAGAEEGGAGAGWLGSIHRAGRRRSGRRR